MVMHMMAVGPFLTIVPMDIKHVRDVVRIHSDNFPGFFLTFLGTRFLRVLYSEILRTSDHIAYVAQNESGTLVGFVVGVCNQTGFYARLGRRRWFPFALASFGAVIRRPTTVQRLFRALRYREVASTAAAQALLMSIAVESEVRSQGVGQQLVNHFLTASKLRNVDSVSLVTDKESNERINRFYQLLGFQIARTYSTPEGRWMNEYVIDLTSWSRSPMLP